MAADRGKDAGINRSSPDHSVSLGARHCPSGRLLLTECLKKRHISLEIRFLQVFEHVILGLVVHRHLVMFAALHRMGAVLRCERNILSRWLASDGQRSEFHNPRMAPMGRVRRVRQVIHGSRCVARFARDGVHPTVVSPGAIWAQVEPGLESEALLANSVKHGRSESTELLITVKNWDSRD